MNMGMSQSLSQRVEQRLVISLPAIQWSLLKAYQHGMTGPPPYVPPTFEEEVFTPVLKLERRQLPGFAEMSHEDKLKSVDVANEVFRFAYTTSEERHVGDQVFYYKIPLVRDFKAEPDRIKIRITKAEFERAEAVLAAVGEMERIVRAIPYHRLFTKVRDHLRGFMTDLNNVVLVSIDRGGRLPCLILRRALGLDSSESLKVDQGGGRLDEDKLQSLVGSGMLHRKHVLFVDSTVDSGRQISVLKRYFSQPTWPGHLAPHTWSVVGSNDHGRDLEHHMNLDWGVDADQTFEDNPTLMGIDYAPGRYDKIVEKPTDASQAIRAAILSVPDGWIYTADDIDVQIETQRREWKKRQSARKREHAQVVRDGQAKHREEVAQHRLECKKGRLISRVESMVARITASKKWAALAAKHQTLPTEVLPSSLSLTTSAQMRNVLVVGRGQQDLSKESVQFVADSLGPHFSFFAGTSSGNPGAVLQAVAANPKVPSPEVRLYQTSGAGKQFGGSPVIVVAGGKDAMREQMIRDSHLVLTLGGAEGTLREVLLSLYMSKPVVLIRGYGPVAEYVLGNRRLNRRPNLFICEGLEPAIRKVFEISSAA